MCIRDSGYTDGELPPKALQAFNYLQSALVAEPLISHPRPGCPYHLSTDAAAGDEDNPGGFAAVLTQLWADGLEHVIAYASRALKPNEKNYSAYLLRVGCCCLGHRSLFSLFAGSSIFPAH